MSPEPLRNAAPATAGSHGALGDLSQLDRGIARYLSSARLAVMALCLGFGGWAGVTSIDGAVIAPAKVVVEANSKSVQHAKGGIVTSIDVRDGQTVKQGALLMTLDGKEIDDRVGALRSQAEARAQQLKLLRSELEDLETLEAKRLVAKSQVNAVRRQLSEMEGDYARLNAELATASTNKSRLELRAPISGRVHKLAVHTVGGVVKAGEELLQIVPDSAELLLEARVAPTDIDQVRAGQTAVVRMASFNQRTTPELKAEVMQVSADLVADERQSSFHYTILLKLGADQVRLLGGKPLLPGMPADVFVRTDSRTVMSYLLKPLTDQFRRAFREE